MSKFIMEGWMIWDNEKKQYVGIGLRHYGPPKIWLMERHAKGARSNGGPSKRFPAEHAKHVARYEMHKVKVIHE